MTEYQIISAKPKDAIELAKVHVQAWQETYSGILPEAYLKKIDCKERQLMWERVFDQKATNRDAVYLLKANNQIVGFSHFGNSRDEGLGEAVGEIFSIYILKSHQKRGFGKALLQKAFLDLSDSGKKAAYLWVLQGNPTIKFYLSQGGQIQGLKTISIGGEQFNEMSVFWPEL